MARAALDRLGVRRLLPVTQLATAAAFLLLFNAPGPGVAVLAAAAVGVPGSVLLITVETHVQRTAPPSMLGRIGALFLAVDAPPAWRLGGAPMPRSPAPWPRRPSPPASASSRHSTPSASSPSWRSR